MSNKTAMVMLMAVIKPDLEFMLGRYARAEAQLEAFVPRL
jgi:hypothetical protein